MDQPGAMTGARPFFLCWLLYAVHWAPFMIREQFPAITLATAGTLNVERFVGWSPDIFRGPNGGAFINNNPGASIAGALPLVIARPVLSALERWNDAHPSSIARAESPDAAERPAVRGRREWYFLAVAFLTAAGVMAPASALTVTALAATMAARGVPRATAVSAGILLGFATPVFVRTSYLNHNLLVCHAGFMAALLLYGGRSQRLRVGRAAIAGALAGFAVLCDYSGVLVLAAGGIYVWLRSGDTESTYGSRLRPVAAYGAGALPLLLTLAAYQWWAFGHSVLPSQHFMPAIEETNRGYRGMSWPSFELLWMNFFDPRFGLFAVCPLLLLGLAAPFVRGARVKLPQREMWVILGIFGALTLFCAANQYSRLQWTTGIRYLLPAVPGLLLLSLQVLQTWPEALQRAIAAASLLFAWIPAVTHQSPPWLLSSAGDFQLSWVRRMAEYGALSHPAAVSAAVLLTTGIAATLTWRNHGARIQTRANGAASNR